MQSMSIRSCVRSLGAVAGAGALCALTLASCGGDSPAGPPDPPGDRGPTIGAIADQAVIRNTIDPRGVDVPLEIEAEDDDAVTVRVDSDDEDVIAGTSFSCVLSDPCVLSLTPAAHRTAEVSLEVTVSGSGDVEARTSFRLSVLPRLVTAEEDNVPGSLRDHVASADPGDVIGFDTDGFFAQPSTVTVIGHVVIDRPMTIEGPGAEALTVSGNGTTRVFKITDGADVVISGLRVADGLAPAESFDSESIHAGGGILVDVGSRLTLSASTVSDSDAGGDSVIPSYGGGIANMGGTLIVRDGSRITGNHALVAGGIASRNVSEAEAVTIIINSLIENNTASGHGGGVLSDGRELVVEASTITGNTAKFGAGAFVERGIAVVDASTITANTAEAGGGLMAFSGSETTIRNGTVIEGNDARRGGGMYMSGVFTIEAGSEIRGNVAEEDGGGVYYNGGSPSSESSVTVVIDDSTLEDNSAQRGGGIFYTYGQGIGSGFAVLHIRNGSRISLNVAEAGGGIFQTQTFGTTGNARTLIDASEIVGNAAMGLGGGGIMNEGGRLVIRSGSSIALNTATNGGGIFTRENTNEAREVVTDIQSGTVTENTATLAGGGVLNRMVLVLRSGASITGNEAFPTPGSGGGVYNVGSFTNGGSVTGNLPDDVAP